MQRVGVSPGMRVLDVGAGTGNAAAAALAAGAVDVVASDPEPRMLAAGRERLGDAVTWVEAGAEELPFADGSFDVVLSCFGAIFAPGHARTAAELARVGGSVGLTAWTSEGPLPKVAALLARNAPPPPPEAGSLLAWGEPGYLRERFEEQGLAVDVTRETLPFEGPSLGAWVEHQERYSTQWNAAQQREGAAWPELREEVRSLLAAANEDPDAFRVTSAYLLAVGRR